MKMYIPNSVKISKLQNKTILLSILSIFLQMSLLIYIYIVISNSSISRVWLIVFLFLVIFNIIFEGIRINNIKKDWGSFNIKLSDKSIIKNQNRKPQIEIDFNEITKITQVNGGISIETSNPKRFVYIPDIIDNYDEFIINLNPIKSIKVNSKRIPPEYAFDLRYKNRTLKKFYIYI